MVWLTPLFISAIILGTLLELWLSGRQVTAVTRHRDAVPEPFAGSVSAQEHAKAADYTIAKARLGRLTGLVDAALALALTLGGGIAAIDALWRHTRWSQPWLGVAVIATVALVIQLINLPFSVWRTFRLEARFGFNRTTPALYLADLAKGMALAVLLGGPLLIATLAAHGARGALMVGVGLGAVARGDVHHGVGVAGVHRAALQPASRR